MSTMTGKTWTLSRPNFLDKITVSLYLHQFLDFTFALLDPLVSRDQKCDRSNILLDSVQDSEAELSFLEDIKDFPSTAFYDIVYGFLPNAFFHWTT